MSEKMELTNKEKKPLRVVVIGGSLAGLMAGIVLRRQGHHVHILEQTSTLPEDHGAGVTVRGSAVDFFAKYDLTGEPYYVSSPGIQRLDAAARVIKSFIDTPLACSSWGALYHRLRANFDGLKSEFCSVPESLGGGEGVVQMGTKATNVSDDNGEVTVEYRDVTTGAEGSIKGDLVIVADGASSTIRQLLLPGVHRKYSGYLAWRGKVLESEMSEEARTILTKSFSAFTYDRGYILCYLIPGTNGSLTPGTRILNYVWYSHCAPTSFAPTLTDIHGRVHHNSLPMGLMRASTWASQLAVGRAALPGIFTELLEKTSSPFLSVVQDSFCRRAAFRGGRVLVVGDALATFRPHTARSLNQAAHDAGLVGRYVGGEIGVREWERGVLRYGRQTQLGSAAFGNFWMFGVWSGVFWRSVVAALWSYVSFLGA